MVLARLKDMVGRTVTLFRYTQKAVQERAIQANQSESEHSILHLPHCHPTDDIVQELITITL